jgi:NAD(P)-dependent dehydrogenase (short-subunit alcohol dehydrogenase family)
MAGLARTCLVTGATGALGKAAAVGLARAGTSVVLVARDRTRGEIAAEEVRAEARNPSVRLLVADLSRMESVRRLAQEAASLLPRLNVLVNCAAVFSRRRVVTSEGFELMFATNVLGPFLLTNLLMGSLRAGSPSRILTVSAPSTTELDFADLQGEKTFRALHAFGASKTADILFTYEIARRLAGEGITANVVHPGLVKSGLMRQAPAPIRILVGLAARPPDRAAEALVRLALAPEFEGVTGRFYKRAELSESSAYSRDPSNQRKLWEAASQLVGLG